MATITDEAMQQMLAKTKAYTIVLLKPGPNASSTDVQTILWEHGRRNLSLRADGKMPIVCPVTEETSVSGLCIFDSVGDEVRNIMDEDPAVKAGIFIYEVHPCLGFPGDRLPE